MKQRLKTVDEVCAAFPIPDRLHKMSNENGKQCDIITCPIFFQKDHSFLYCNIPKVGCSTFKVDLLQLAGIRLSNENFIHPAADNYLLRISPNYLNDLEASKLKKFVFVRHPFERIASAFSDKTRPEVYDIYFLNMWAPILKKYRGLEEATLDHVPTFKEFVMSLIDSPIESYNEHWQPFWYRCAPCNLKYDYVGKMETFSRDKDIIYDEIGISKLIKKKWINKSNSRDKIKEYYSQITKVDLLKLFQKYYYDFLLFDYEIGPYLDYVQE